MPKKAIIIFSTAYFPLVGGAEVAIKEITDRIHGYNFFLITTRLNRKHPPKEQIGNVEVYRVGTGIASIFDKILSPFLGAILTRRLMKRRNVSLFWSVMITFTSGAPFLLKIFGPGRKIPLLLTIQEGDSEKHLKYANLGLTGVAWFFAVRLADYIQAISEYLKNFAIRMGAKTPIEIIPNGADLQKIKSQTANLKSTSQNLKLKLNIKPDEKVIITTSRLVYKNAIDVIIDAIYRLQTADYRLPMIKLLIAGDGPEKEKLKFKIKNLKLQNQIILLGSVPPDEIYKYLAIADIFVRPSRSEGLGNSFLEAMAMEVPIIGTPVGGIPDFLTDKETGLFCKVDDPKNLAEKIKTLLENDALRERLIENAKNLMEEKYDWDNISRKMDRIFASLI